MTFAGNIALSANEGEPRMGYESGTDPLGSVTAVDLSASSPEARTITFESFDAKRDELVADKVLLKKDTAPFRPTRTRIHSGEREQGFRCSAGGQRRCHA